MVLDLTDSAIGCVCRQILTEHPFILSRIRSIDKFFKQGGNAVIEVSLGNVSEIQKTCMN